MQRHRFPKIRTRTLDGRRSCPEQQNTPAGPSGAGRPPTPRGPASLPARPPRPRAAAPARARPPGAARPARPPSAALGGPASCRPRRRRCRRPAPGPRLVSAGVIAGPPARSGPPGGLRRDDLRRDGHRLGIESNAATIAGDGQPVRLTDRHSLVRTRPPRRRRPRPDRPPGRRAARARPRAMTLPLRGMLEPNGVGHARIIIANSSGRTCGSAKKCPADFVCG